jgi:hypothetical protein
MDGSSLSIVLIPIVVVICLAAWLIMVACAASHPEWKHSPASPPRSSEPAARADQRPLDASPALTEVPRPRQSTETRPKVTAGHAGR